MKKTLLLLLVLLSSLSMVFAQQREITGKVTASDDGTALPGVSVVVKGTTIGTSTDADGNFKLRISDNAAVLVLSYLGYISKEVPVGSQSSFNLSLTPDNQQLNEVVVTALGIERSERSLGYATQEVKGENLTFTKEQNVLGSLAGKVAGVQVTGSSGASMGGTQKLVIRGVNSINGSSPPLLVVDGTPIANTNFAGEAGADFGNLGQDINPEDIESINVLKGPAASALYGIRGQYGVIMITTKKGAKGAKKVTVELSSAFSIEKTGNFMPLQNLYGGGSKQTWNTLPNGQKVVQLEVDESWGPKMDGTPVRQFYSFYPKDLDFGKETPFLPHPNNIRDYYETGSNLNNGVTISGGGENTNFRLSFNDTRIEGVEPNTFLRRNNVGVSAGIDISKKLNVSTNLNIATNNARRPTQGSEFGARYTNQWFQRNVDMNRLRDYKYDDGRFLQWNLRAVPLTGASAGVVSNFKALYWNNPFFEAYENPVDDSRDRLFGDIGLTYQVLPALKLSGFMRGDMYTQNIESRIGFGGQEAVPAYSVGKYQGQQMNYEFLAQYNKEWGDFSINTNLGANLFTDRYTYLSMATVGGLSAPGFYNIDASIDRPATSSYLRRKEVRSAYAMVSLGYKDTYFLDASIRNDNSSALPPDNNSYYYPSLSGSFVFSELLDWNPLSLGKLRASYAQAGSDLAPYQTTTFYSAGTVYAGTTSVNPLSVPDNLTNPLIEPSFAHSYEAGMDLKFFQNRLGLDLTFYRQKNVNQIIPLQVSGASGYGSTTINAGLIENKGFELSLSGTPIDKSFITWNTTLNISRNRSKVVELAPGINVYNHYSTTYSSVTSFLNSYAGQAFGTLVGPTYQRDAATGKILLDSNGIPLFTAATHNFGTVLPDLTGGFQNSVRLWKFDVSAMIDYQVGGQFFSRSKMLAMRTGQAAETAALNDNGKNVRDPVSEGGGVKVNGIYGPGTPKAGQEVTLYVNPQTYYGTTARRIYDDWLYDASYVKLREVRIGYILDKSMLGKLPFERVGLALISRNVAQLWQKAPKGLDPSELSSGGQAISWYESGQLPTVRSYGVNLNITF
ncbi:SusC/RagA family TonB-linked outer membrane protein [Rufibacter glacialis]|uniref:SusC/RagA family TonB-linked outer membrane protein n=1 Tax=Rufibacter glacialis TaxID=1259555 RepID=A0A5M8QE33_9BACT|nr:SusC/RagA family TonB-linked outer membrane protein [Rufibacter glacialis]KAA6433180.1 SusC/RagA family TonB-linked outer membrane protein [Rufibacter glacialis]GGK76700.1 SusC/RagA family TonB-linked outer membrane protein [Rufibacter glacialis]